MQQLLPKMLKKGQNIAAFHQATADLHEHWKLKKCADKHINAREQTFCHYKVKMNEKINQCSA